ncbi:COG4705 family protein [Aestuariivirga litoralis]|uniref:COG4705 family protein n=1 Tax=Aestuariivirga litoralis TaxID=2650924 RepID=UPI0018C80184|nr:hypothetical protein [Aestuariivirga litoralis]MBG1233882.1 hypothetical protein [Aestuariivirga litoralis]
MRALETADMRATEQFWSKVPLVTITFWLIKIMATTVGETAADLLAMRLGLGLTITSLIMTGVFIIFLILQMRAKFYVPLLYWMTVVLISVVGTLISDNLVDGFGISLVTTTIVFGIILAAVFLAWYNSEGTLSIHSITTFRRESFYWLAILFTFALGTSAGDLVAEGFDLGYLTAANVFGLMIVLTALGYFAFGLNAVGCFWIAYILTRPFGASIGDFLSKPNIAGGLGLGTVTTSMIFLGLIAALVAYLTATRVDREEIQHKA